MGGLAYHVLNRAVAREEHRLARTGGRNAQFNVPYVYAGWRQILKAIQGHFV